MTAARAVYAHELRPGTAFSMNPPDDPVFLVVSRELVGERGAVAVSLHTLRYGSDGVTSGVVFVEPQDVVYVPAEYPTEHVDNMPADYWPDDE